MSLQCSLLNMPCHWSDFIFQNFVLVTCYCQSFKFARTWELGSHIMFSQVCLGEPKWVVIDSDTSHVRLFAGSCCLDYGRTSQWWTWLNPCIPEQDPMVHHSGVDEQISTMVKYWLFNSTSLVTIHFGKKIVISWFMGLSSTYQDSRNHLHYS